MTYEVKGGQLTIWRGKNVHHQASVSDKAASQAILDGYAQHGLIISPKP